MLERALEGLPIRFGQFDPVSGFTPFSAPKGSTSAMRKSQPSFGWYQISRYLHRSFGFSGDF
jgi:hypothetical protein